MNATETKVCRQCGKLLPLSGFRSTRWGGKTEVCNACIAEKRADTHYNRAHVGGRTDPLFRPGLRQAGASRSHQHNDTLPQVA